MSLEHRVVQVGRRWAIVTIDDVAVQCTVPSARQPGTSGGPDRFCVRGYGDSSIQEAARYSLKFGTTYSTEEAAELVASDELDEDELDAALVRRMGL